MLTHQRAFTLIELLVTMAILAILVGIAVPSYRSYLTRSYLTEAFDSLSVFRLAMEQAYQDNANYGTGGNCAVSVPTSPSFTYTCQLNNSGQTYVATASGNGNHAISGFQYSINDQGIRSTTLFPNGTVPVNCWLTSSNGCS